MIVCPKNTPRILLTFFLPRNTNVPGNIANNNMISNLEVWFGQIMYADFELISDSFWDLYQKPFKIRTNRHQYLQKR